MHNQSHADSVNNLLSMISVKSKDLFMFEPYRESEEPQPNSMQKSVQSKNSLLFRPKRHNYSGNSSSAQKNTKIRNTSAINTQTTSQMISPSGPSLVSFNEQPKETSLEPTEIAIQLVSVHFFIEVKLSTVLFDQKLAGTKFKHFQIEAVCENKTVKSDKISSNSLILRQNDKDKRKVKLNLDDTFEGHTKFSSGCHSKNSTCLAIKLIGLEDLLDKKISSKRRSTSLELKNFRSKPWVLGEIRFDYQQLMEVSGVPRILSVRGSNQHGEWSVDLDALINLFDAEMRLVRKEKKVVKKKPKEDKTKAFEIEKMQLEHAALVDSLQDKLTQANSKAATTARKQEMMKVNLISKYEQLAQMKDEFAKEKQTIENQAMSHIQQLEEKINKGSAENKNQFESILNTKNEEIEALKKTNAQLTCSLKEQDEREERAIVLVKRLQKQVQFMQVYREGKSSESTSKYHTPEPVKDRSEGMFDFQNSSDFKLDYVNSPEIKMNDRTNLNIDVKSDSQTTNIEKTRTLDFVAKVDQLVNADLNERLEQVENDLERECHANAELLRVRDQQHMELLYQLESKDDEISKLQDTVQQLDEEISSHMNFATDQCIQLEHQLTSKDQLIASLEQKLSDACQKLDQADAQINQLHESNSAYEKELNGKQQQQARDKGAFEKKQLVTYYVNELIATKTIDQMKAIQQQESRAKLALKNIQITVEDTDKELDAEQSIQFDKSLQLYQYQSQAVLSKPMKTSKDYWNYIKDEVLAKEQILFEKESLLQMMADKFGTERRMGTSQSQQVIKTYLN